MTDVNGTVTVTPHTSPDDRNWHRDFSAADLKFLRTGKRPKARGPKLSTPRGPDDVPKGWRLRNAA